MWGETEFKIQEEIIELHLDQTYFSSGVTAIKALIEPSTNPSLLLASKSHPHSSSPSRVIILS